MARFKCDVFCFALLVGICCTVALANRVHLAHKCVTSLSECAEKLPVIMLHGLSDVKETWDGIYQSIDHLTGRRVCIYDARNHGDSEWNDVLNVDVLSEDLGNFMEDMKIEKASLVGHSMGGLTIMKFALKNPEKVESIFVEDIAPKNVSREAYEYFKTAYPILLNSLSAIPTDADEETAKKAVMDYLTKVTKAPMEYLFRRFPLRYEDDAWQWKANFKLFAEVLEEEGYFVGKMEGQYDGRAFFIYGTASAAKVNYGYLAYDCLDSHWTSPDKSPVIMLHGIGDIKETWDGIYQKIPLLTRRKVCIYDARNHGDSSWNNTFDIDALADELEVFMDNLNIEKAALVGHSMGGFTLMKFALNHPNRVESIFVEDISPKAPPEQVAAALRAGFDVLLKSLSAVPPHADPKAVVETVTGLISEVIGEQERQYLFKRFPFRRWHGRWQWKTNFELLSKALEDPIEWIGKMEGLFKEKAFFVYGKLSPLRVIEDEVFIRMLFPKAEFFGIEGAGHLIHQDFPVLCERLIEFLNQHEDHSYPVKSFFQSDRFINFKPHGYVIKSYFHKE